MQELRVVKTSTSAIGGIGSLLLVASALVCLAGCGDDWAKTLDNGAPVPTSRIRIHFEGQLERSVLYEDFRELAEGEGLTEYRGQEITESSIGPDGHVASFGWEPRTDSVIRYRLDVVLHFRSQARPEYVDVLIVNQRSMSNGAQEWLLFQRWRDELLPTKFPNAELEVTRHPAAHTLREELVEIAEATGMEIPPSIDEATASDQN